MIRCLKFVADRVDPFLVGKAVLFIEEYGLLVFDVGYDTSAEPADQIAFPRQIASDGQTTITRELIQVPEGRRIEFVLAASEAIGEYLREAREHLQRLKAEQVGTEKPALSAPIPDPRLPVN